MVNRKRRGRTNRKRSRILAYGTLKMVNKKQNPNDIPSTSTQVQLNQQTADVDYNGTPLPPPLPPRPPPPPPPATGMEASSSQQPPLEHRRGRKKKRLDEVGPLTQQ
ncbi:unnamed protein product [Camellia sinensis]